jgi:hypothetical protein
MGTERKEVDVAMTIDERLTRFGRHIDDLEARARLHGAEQRQRVRRHVQVLREEHANALAAARRGPAQLDDRVARLRSRLEVAERSFEADLAEDRCRFGAAVEAELHSWDLFAERLQTAAAASSASARQQAEAGIKRLRRQRLTVTERLNELRAARWGTWRQQRTRVTAARDELERIADDLSTSLF